MGQSHTIGESKDLVMNSSCAACIVNIFVSCIKLCVSNIAHDGVVE